MTAKGARLRCSVEHLGGSREAKILAYEWGNATPRAWIIVTWDDTCAYAGNLYATGAAPFGAAYHLIGAAALFLRDIARAPGVLIHTEGINTTRRFYRRLGFRPVPEIPGLMVARIEDTCAPFTHMPKTPAEKEKPPE